MALSNLGSLVLNLLIFITTLVNFSYALTTLEPLLLLVLYAISKLFVTPPEEGSSQDVRWITYIRTHEKIIPENGYASPMGSHSPSEGRVSASGPAETALEEAVQRRERDNADYGFTHVTDQENGHTLAHRKVSIRDRIGCFTWTWYLMTMATGGIANVLHAIPYRLHWLNTIGTAIFLYNVLLFLLVTVVLCMRFCMHPGSFSASFTHQSESLFIPAFLVTIATILINICQYGIPYTGPWLEYTMAGLFWTYITVAMLASSAIYLILWSTQTFPVHTMTPIWIFPAYPLLLAAPLGANLIDAVPSAASASQINSLAITFGAIVMQGTGFLVSMMIYGAFIYRLMTQKLPREQLRPGIFVSVGPSGFTVAGLVHLGNLVTTKTVPFGYMGDPATAPVLRLLADMVGLWLWGLCVWFFLVSVGAHWNVVWPRGSQRKIHFAMTWYSYVFPNTALTTATLAIGKSIESEIMQIAGTVMAACLVLVWIMVFGTMIRAVVRRRLLWPEKES